MVFDRFRAKKAYGRVSKKADVGVDVADSDDRYIAETRAAMKNAKDNDEDGLIESKDEARKRRGDSWRAKTAGVRSGVKSARKNYREFKNSPEVRSFRSSMKQSGRRAESGFDMSAESMLGFGPPRRQERQRAYEPVYGARGQRIGSRRIYRQPDQQRQGGMDVFEMFGMRNGGYGQVRSNRPQRDPFDFSDLI